MPISGSTARTTACSRPRITGTTCAPPRTNRLKHGPLPALVDIFNADNHHHGDGDDTPSATFVNGQLIETQLPLTLLLRLPGFGLSREF